MIWIYCYRHYHHIIAFSPASCLRAAPACSMISRDSQKHNQAVGLGSSASLEIAADLVVLITAIAHSHSVHRIF